MSRLVAVDVVDQTRRDTRVGLRGQLEQPALGGLADVSILDLPRFDVLQERIRTVTRTTQATRVYAGEAVMSSRQTESIPLPSS